MSHDFLDFASSIYRERPKWPGRPRYWLPALYGGDNREGRFFAAVVLEQPSQRFMEDTRIKFWAEEPSSVAAAVAVHRCIFFEWAQGSPQADLFRILINLAHKRPAHSPEGLRNLTAEDFFRQLYVTDVWKDGVHDSAYWCPVLSRELANIQVEMVLLVGSNARGYRSLCPKNIRVEECFFPSGANRGRWTAEYVADMAALLENPSGSPRPPRPLVKESNVDVRPLARSEPTRFSAIQTWTLNAEHGFYVRTGIRVRVVELCLGYKDPSGTVTPVGRFTLDLESLARQGLVKHRIKEQVPVFDVRIFRDSAGSYWLGTENGKRIDLTTLTATLSGG